LDLAIVFLFILYIVFRSMSDRRRGMSREPGRKRPAPAAATGQPRPQQRRVLIPEEMPLPEGGSAYDRLVYMEGAEPEEPEEKGEKADRKQEADQPAPYYGEAVGGTFAFISGDELRKAVVWAEVLQNPRFRNPYRFDKTFCNK